MKKNLRTKTIGHLRDDIKGYVKQVLDLKREIEEDKELIRDMEGKKMKRQSKDDRMDESLGMRKSRKDKKEDIMKIFKKHFKRDDDLDDAFENEDEVKPMTLYDKKSDRRKSLNEDYDEDTPPHSGIYGSEWHSTDENRMYGENDESNDEGYDSIKRRKSSSDNDRDDDYDDDEDDKMKKREKRIPKEQRKRLSITILAKKLSKPKEKR